MRASSRLPSFSKLKIVSMSINIYKGSGELTYKHFHFPAGEVSVKLDTTNYNFLLSQDRPRLVARLKSGNDFMALALLKNALKEAGQKNPDLFIPYFNYGQQDRVCDKGESFSLSVFANLINSLNFETVTVADPHSTVLNNNMVNNLKIISHFDIIHHWEKLNQRLRRCCLLAPDAGANKKVGEIAKYFEHERFVRADKLRDLKTGKIVETIVYANDFQGQDVAIIDDICVGGATFVALASELKKKNAGRIILYITHGIFSNGVEPLLKSGIDEIWTTDSYQPLVSLNAPGIYQASLQNLFLHAV